MDSIPNSKVWSGTGMRIKVVETINKFGMLKQNDNILVALSGGADSVTLLPLLNILKSIRLIFGHAMLITRLGTKKHKEMKILCGIYAKIWLFH